MQATPDSPLTQVEAAAAAATQTKPPATATLKRQESDKTRSTTSYRTRIDMRADEFADEQRKNLRDGFTAVWISSYVVDDKPAFAAVWYPSPPGIAGK